MILLNKNMLKPNEQENLTMASNSSGRYIMVVIAAVTWGMFGIISELLFSKGIDPISVGTYRATISFLLFFYLPLFLKEIV